MPCGLLVKNGSNISFNYSNGMQLAADPNNPNALVHVTYVNVLAA
jgi:hypothetical protein